MELKERLKKLAPDSVWEKDNGCWRLIDDIDDENHTWKVETSGKKALEYYYPGKSLALGLHRICYTKNCLSKEHLTSISISDKKRLASGDKIEKLEERIIFKKTLEELEFEKNREAIIAASTYQLNLNRAVRRAQEIIMDSDPIFVKSEEEKFIEYMPEFFKVELLNKIYENLKFDLAEAMIDKNLDLATKIWEKIDRLLKNNDHKFKVE